MASRGAQPAAKQHCKLLMAARRGDCKGLTSQLAASVSGVVVGIEGADTSDVTIDVTSGLMSEDVVDTEVADTSSGSVPGVVVADVTSRLELEILHVVASTGDNVDHLASATAVHDKAKHLLDASNEKGDTPLHCAARAGRILMVSHLISLAQSENSRETGDACTIRAKEVLRKQNKQGRTVLHEALCLADKEMVKKMVGELMSADTELARIPQNNGTSPLYLAISLGHDAIAKLLYTKDKELSYSGPAGQNALHVAVLRSREVTRKLLKWNEDLTTQRDGNGNLPLHFAASLPTRQHRTSACRQVLEANPDMLYESNNDGLFPIHVAASAGAGWTVAMFLDKYPSSACLCDKNGRTFLHVAIMKRKRHIVSSASKDRSISWILNMQDNGGNTALHLAIQSGSLQMFCALFGNRQVHLNLTNEKGLTPLDISQDKIPRGIYYNQNNELKIRGALRFAGARKGVCLHDNLDESSVVEQKKHDKKEAEKLKDSTQTLCVGSALIATVTFGATFAVPGGYIAGEQTNGGTPVLAGKYVFHAFVMANTFAFICSAIATIGLMYSGASMVSLMSRRIHFATSAYFMSTSITSLTTAFVLGAYMVLAPVAHKTAIAICVLSFLIVLYRESEYLLKQVLLAIPLSRRKGLIRTLAFLAMNVVVFMVLEFWPLIFSFGWAAYATNHPGAKMEPPAQPPITLV